MGRKKIEMTLVKDTGSRQMTFSKRRNGLFKKANELATLCAAEVAIVVFSPGGKPFSFGHPNVDSVVQRFLNQETFQHVDDPKQGEVQKLNEELNDLLKQLEIEKERGRELDKALKADQAICRYKNLKNDEADQDELSVMKAAFQKLRAKVKGCASEMEASSSLLLLNENESDK